MRIKASGSESPELALLMKKKERMTIGYFLHSCMVQAYLIISMDVCGGGGGGGELDRKAFWHRSLICKLL